MGLLEDMIVYLLKEVFDDLNIIYRLSEKKVDLIEKVCYVWVILYDVWYDYNFRSYVFFFF